MTGTSLEPISYTADLGFPGDYYWEPQVFAKEMKTIWRNS